MVPRPLPAWFVPPVRGVGALLVTAGTVAAAVTAALLATSGFGVASLWVMAVAVAALPSLLVRLVGGTFPPSREVALMTVAAHLMGAVMLAWHGTSMAGYAISGDAAMAFGSGAVAVLYGRFFAVSAWAFRVALAGVPARTSR